MYSDKGALEPVQVFPVFHKFSASDWQRVWLDVDLPEERSWHFEEYLDGECPFKPGKTIRETHSLVYLPQQINDFDFSINDLRLMFGDMLMTAEEHRLFRDAAFMEILPRYRWLLMYSGVIPGSLGAEPNKDLPTGYLQPTAVEYVGYLLTKYIAQGEYLGEYPAGWTADCDCQGLRICIGDQYLEDGGIMINAFTQSQADVGLYAFRPLG